VDQDGLLGFQHLRIKVELIDVEHRPYLTLDHVYDVVAPRRATDEVRDAAVPEHHDHRQAGYPALMADLVAFGSESISTATTFTRPSKRAATSWMTAPSYWLGTHQAARNATTTGEPCCKTCCLDSRSDTLATAMTTTPPSPR
jgi:hypothetical protein